jgi:chorismate synthase
VAFRFLTSGESRGEALTAVIDGVRAGLSLTEDHLNEDLARRQRGYGHGGRMKIVRAAMTPIPTLRKPLRSVDVATKEAVEAVVERSDVCAVPAAGVVGEAMMAITLARAFLEKFGGDSIDEIHRNHQAYLDSSKAW